ncbi:MAG: biopolymer transporter ExbD [Steroidobacteraceae bacterium]
MAMSVGNSGGDGVMCEMNTTPLIDVMLVLLVTLIVSLPIMTHAVKLDMPPPNPNQPPPQVQPEIVDLDIDSDGAVVWNGEVLASIGDLEARFRTKVNDDPQPEIHLRPDPRARYDQVAKVLAAAQRNSMQKIGFVNIAQFAEE